MLTIFKKWAFQIGSSKLGAKKARQFEKEINRIVKLTKKIITSLAAPFRCEGKRMREIGRLSDVRFS